MILAMSFGNDLYEAEPFRYDAEHRNAKSITLVHSLRWNVFLCIPALLS